MTDDQLPDEVRRELGAFKKRAPAPFYLVTKQWDVNDDSDNEQHVVSEGSVDRFVEATLQLHFKPGVNPHTNVATKPVQYLTVAALQPMGPFWDTTPGLQENDDPRGAMTWEWATADIVWIRPGVQLPDDDEEG
jgi:hypothetical protein